MSKESQKKLQKDILKAFGGKLLPPEASIVETAIDGFKATVNVALDVVLNAACPYASGEEFDRMSPDERSSYLSGLAERAERVADAHQMWGDPNKAEDARNVAREAREEAKAWRYISKKNK